MPTILTKASATTFFTTKGTLCPRLFARLTTMGAVFATLRGFDFEIHY